MTTVWCKSCKEYHQATGAWWSELKKHEQSSAVGIKIPALAIHAPVSEDTADALIYYSLSTQTSPPND